MVEHFGCLENSNGCHNHGKKKVTGMSSDPTQSGPDGPAMSFILRFSRSSKHLAVLRLALLVPSSLSPLLLPTFIAGDRLNRWEGWEWRRRDELCNMGISLVSGSTRSLVSMR